MPNISNLKIALKGYKLTINFNGKKLDVDLQKELGISESLISSQLCSQPSNYALLCMIKSEAIGKRDLSEKEKDLAFSKAYINIKESNSRITNELATHKANASAKYQLAYEKYLKAKEKAETLISVCRAFEQRAQLLQTISSNLRKES